MDDTYCKLFRSLYTGSLYGAGLSVMATWPWILAHADENGLVEINPLLVANELGCTADDVNSAISYLASPDPRSRTPDEGGRRIIAVGGFTWRVVNRDEYRKRGGSRAAYWRKWRKEHGGKSGDDDDPSEGATVAQRCAQPSATQAKAKSKTETQENLKHLGDSRPSDSLTSEDLRQAMRTGNERLAKALTEAFPQTTKWQRNTLERIVRYFYLHIQDHPEDLHWYEDAVKWLDVAKQDGDSVWRLWLHLLKKNTTYRPKLGGRRD